MANFETAIVPLLTNEGGFVDNPNDAGGATNFGISLRLLREIPADRLRRYGIFDDPQTLNITTIRELTIDQAKLIYKGEFWDQAPFVDIRNPYLCNYIFDMAVLHGLSTAFRLVQRALWASKMKYMTLLDDGIMGSKTLRAINEAEPICLQKILMAERAGYMRLLVNDRPQEKEFLNGWLKRCYQE